MVDVRRTCTSCLAGENIFAVLFGAASGAAITHFTFNII